MILKVVIATSLIFFFFTYFTLLVNSPPHSERDPSRLGRLSHERDDLMVRRVEYGRSVHCDDLVTREEAAVHIRSTAGDNVADGYLKKQREKIGSCRDVLGNL